MNIVLPQKIIIICGHDFCVIGLGFWSHKHSFYVGLASALSRRKIKPSLCFFNKKQTSLKLPLEMHVLAPHLPPQH